MKVAPSILAADFSKLGAEVHRAAKAGADWIHLDVMDGAFVPNLTFGAPVIRALRPATEIPFDVHLMMLHPKKYIKDFCSAGANVISFHLESEDDAAETIAEIQKYGAKPAVALKPQTPVQALKPYLKDLYMILIMTVEPGFGGQTFMEEMLEKVRALKKIAPHVLVEVDGGINQMTVGLCAQAGVDIVVAGTAVFTEKDIKRAIKLLQQVKN